MKYAFEVQVLPREVVLDVQGRTIQHSFVENGLSEIKTVKVGKSFILEIESDTVELAQEKCQQAAQQFLYNPLTETFMLKKMAL